jgi:fibronectin type 3 domain-containing protein
MKKFFFSLIIPVIPLLLTSCGKKGPIQPPIVKAPKKVEIFTMIQRGDKVRLRWQNPIAYRDGAPLDTIGEVEVWLAKEERESHDDDEVQQHVNLEQISGKDFQKKAALILTIRGNELSNYIGELKEGSLLFQYFYEIKDKDFLSKKYIFGLRVKDRKNRVSEFSEILSVEPRILPLPPQNLVISVHSDHIKLMWDSPEKNIDESSPANVSGYNIYRKDREGIVTRLNSELIKATEFKDLKFLFGETYQYYVRASATPSEPYLQSLDSELVEIMPKDTFPPQPPSGLIVMSGVDSISLSWDKNMEKDFHGYRVWRRKEGEEEYSLLTPEAIRENTFTDTTIEKGIRYHYVVTAVDKYDNESEKSDSVSEIKKDRIHENLSF